MEIGLGILAGAWSASNLTHGALIVLLFFAPVIAWCDFRTRRIPETISLPWLAFAITLAVLRLPGSASALIGTAITAAVLAVMVCTGIVNRRHVLGVADLLVFVAILATFSDSQTFPTTIIFYAMALTVVAAAGISLAYNALQRHPLGAPGPIAGSLALGALLVAVPASFLAR